MADETIEGSDRFQRATQDDRGVYYWEELYSRGLPSSISTFNPERSRI